MKTETNTLPANSSPCKMDFDMYPSISSGKQQDVVREVVMKYIDYFLPDASGTNAVAIDNKIEQAMDLVKSHLMIAVREEVEVLKEKISELMDKINQLEVENTILKANVSQETLQQVQKETQLQIASSTPTHNTNIVKGTSLPASVVAAAAAGAPISAAAAAVANAAISVSGSNTAAPKSNVGSGTATPTTQQPKTVTADQTQNAADKGQAQSAQSTNGPMS